MFDWLTGYVDPNDISDRMQEGVDLVDTDATKGLGMSMFDPNSQYNQRWRKSIQGESMDSMAMNSNLGSRQASMGLGLGNSAREKAYNASAYDNVQKKWLASMGQSGQMGVGLLGQGMQGDIANMGTQQQWATGAANQMSQNASNKSSMFQGLLGGAASLGNSWAMQNQNQDFMSGLFGG